MVNKDTHSDDSSGASLAIDDFWTKDTLKLDSVSYMYIDEYTYNNTSLSPNIL